MEAEAEEWAGRRMRLLLNKLRRTGLGLPGKREDVDLEAMIGIDSRDAAVLPIEIHVLLTKWDEEPTLVAGGPPAHQGPYRRGLGPYRILWITVRPACRVIDALRCYQQSLFVLVTPQCPYAIMSTFDIHPLNRFAGLSAAIRRPKVSS